MAGVEDDVGAAVVQAGVVPSDLPGLGPEEVLVATWGEIQSGLAEGKTGRLEVKDSETFVHFGPKLKALVLSLHAIKKF